MKLLPILFTASLFLACNSEKKKDQNTSSSEEFTISDNLQQEKVSESFARGKEVFSNFCVTCHLPSGKGIPGNFPPLAGSNWLVDKRTESLKAIKYGLSGPIEVNGESYNNVMAPQGLSDQEVADVMNYISNSWGNSSKKEVTIEEVKAISK
ncbi:cytochrome c [Gillisia mitskevichiae]|uniref:Cytochrome c n=1 Tax=Gillisia mitskevichiae TaxID=270921 RepID=A0A495PRZ3_9FLAO|nr:cytochrome c [Gillisia mitskevichiae]RKS53414.1 cytochrome c [Gillisia mitskevichiae]